MNALKIVETDPGRYSLLLDAGAVPVFDLIRELDREPNGYFWEGVAGLLIAAEAPGLKDQFEFDSEAGMFCAYGENRQALEDLGTLIAAVATDHDRMRRLVEQADADGFDWDD